MMQPLVQSAIDAAHRGENNKALEFLKQALTVNPNDVEAWLVVAAVVEQPERKRQCLNRVLTLDPTNQIARDELLQMDRAATGHTPPFIPEPTPQSKPTYPSAPPPPAYPTGTSDFEPEPTPQPIYSSPSYPTSPAAFEPEPVMDARQDISETPAPVASQAEADSKAPSQTLAEKPLVFKSPLLWRILMYFSLVAFSGFGFLMMLDKDLFSGLLFLALAVLTGVGIMAISSQVEVSESGIRVSNILSTSEVQWNEIKSVKSSSRKQRLVLHKSNGQVVKVSNQVSGYPRIVEILRQTRPDLFDLPGSSSAQGSISTPESYEPDLSSGYGRSAPKAVFSGTKVFKRSFFKQYGSYFFWAPLCLLASWVAFTRPEYTTGAAIVTFLGIGMMIFTLFNVSAIKIESNKLTIETFFVEKTFTVRHIREIKMQSVRGRYGRVVSSVHIVPVKEKKYELQGFAAGNEVIYGFLMNWWNAYRSGSL